MIAPDREGGFQASDGVELRYQVFGQGHPVLVANGIGVSHGGLALQLAQLRERFRQLCWDYRGVFGSVAPRGTDLSVQSHARDGLALLDTLEVERAALLGWSMGVQVGFELHRLQPGRLTRLACIGGLPASPFRARLPLPGLHRLAPPVLELAARGAPAFSPVVRQVAKRSAFYHLARTSRFIRKRADRRVFMEMARAVGGHDHRIYLRTLAEMGRHDARQALDELDVPLLLIVGAQDHLVPARHVRRAAARARGAQLLVVPDASHFVTAEAPEVVNPALERFFQGDAKAG